MRGRTGAVLVVAAGLGCLVLATSVRSTRPLSEASAAPAIVQQTPSVPIDWDGARRDARSRPSGPVGTLIDAFAAANREKIAAVTIPVLLPGDADLLRDLEIFPNGAFYSASSSSRGMGLLITGSGRSLAAAAGHSPAQGIDVERSESGVEASFLRYGASYSVGLDCRRPEDERCSGPAYLRGLVSRLVVLTAPAR
jgi:hypothetical protein